MPKGVTAFDLLELPDTLRRIQGTVAVVRDALCAHDPDEIYIAAAEQLGRYVVEPLDVEITGLTKHMKRLRAASAVTPKAALKKNRRARK